MLDGQLIGSHRFELSAPASTGVPGGERQLLSEARYDVRLLGFTVYRYRHSASERWRGDCLVSLQARTDDNGQASTVQQQPAACVMSYAYWHPELRRQSQLLNPQTGRLDAVRAEPAGRRSMDTANGPVEADGWRLATPQGPVLVWTRPDGRWVGLDATVAGGRTLQYRESRETSR